VPDLLLEAEDYSADARAYRDAAHQRALWAAWRSRCAVSRWIWPNCGGGSTVKSFSGRSSRTVVRDPRIADWLLRLEDVLDTRGLVLFSLEVADYPHATRKVASWILLGMGRLARQLGDVDTGTPAAPRALLLVDEVGALGHGARHLRGLVGRARESGLAVVLATQGPSDLEAVDRALLPQVLQDTAWQLAFRQGSPQDAERMQALFGQAWIEDLTRYSDGRFSTRHVERPRVRVDEWMNALEPGDAWLRVAPIDRRWRQERVRVALPRVVTPAPPTIPYVSRQPRLPAGDPDNPTVNPTPQPNSWAPSGAGDGAAGGVDNESVSLAVFRGESSGPATGPVTREQRLLQDPDAVRYVWARIQSRGAHRLYWTGPRDRKGYGRVRWKGQEYQAHRVVWTALVGPIPEGDDWTIDHGCPGGIDKACCTPEHEQVVQRPRNTRLRWERQQSAAAAAPAAFAIALFAGIDRPSVEQRTVSLDELRRLLSRFEVLDDKRRGRCWSPTEYADGATSRGNAGVLQVSALVFDLDRVPPDPERLAGVHWLGHTTWSHTPIAPRWRVVIPLTTPVPSARWRDVWRRARAALCPEADPACKDPSRAYWLPSHSGGVTAKTTCHDGPLLDPSTLPALPPEPPRAELRTSPTAQHLRRPRDGDRRRGEAYLDRVIAGLEGTPPGGRNAALNRAAWTLGRWVAAGALEQADVEDELYAAAETCHLVADDGDRQCWATIRSGLSAGLQQPIDLDADGQRR